MPTDANEERSAKPGVCAAADAHCAHGSHVQQKRMTLSPTREETKPPAHDHFSWTVLSSGTPSGDRTLGVPRVALREEAEGQVRR